MPPRLRRPPAALRALRIYCCFSLIFSNPFRTAVPFWGQITYILTGLSPNWTAVLKGLTAFLFSLPSNNHGGLSDAKIPGGVPHVTDSFPPPPSATYASSLFFHFYREKTSFQPFLFSLARVEAIPNCKQFERSKLLGDSARSFVAAVAVVAVVLTTSNRSFYPTASVQPVPVPILHPREVAHSVVVPCHMQHAAAVAVVIYCKHNTEKTKMIE